MLDTLAGKFTTAKLWAKSTDIEPQAREQLINIASIPQVVHVAVMPDVHYGKGATVGSVIAMRNAVSPAAVGVDVGCGMLAVRTSLRANDLKDLPGLRAKIENLVPVGFNSHDSGNQLQGRFGDKDAIHLQVQTNNLFARFGDLQISSTHSVDRALAQIGTLGGGNHFIEICVDQGNCIAPECVDGIVDHDNSPVHIYCGECNGTGKIEPSVWILLHSGSRNIGKVLAELHISQAKQLLHNADLADPDLATLLDGSPEMAAYRHDLYWAQTYALLNRRVMLDLIKQALWSHLGDQIKFDAPIECHHNYLAEEFHFGETLFVTRKGAISAKLNEYGIIPGSMGTPSFIVRGLGNADSLTSASHGAGRRMSRGAAKRQFKIGDLEEQTRGVECRKDIDVLDEIPEAYKNIRSVMRDQADLVRPIAELKQVLCVKG